MKILISGATGLIGTALIPVLEHDGHSITRLVRGTPRTTSQEIPWTPGQPLDPALVEPFDAVIHLAARNIGVRWNEKIKRDLIESRVQGTRTIAEATAAAFLGSGRPLTFISAAAIGYYGSRGDEVLTDASMSGNGFLSEIARQWEAATQAASDAGVRVVLPRLVWSSAPKAADSLACFPRSGWASEVPLAADVNGSAGSVSKTLWVGSASRLRLPA